MEKIKEITKGKAKSLFTTSNDNQLVMHFSDDTSAFDGKKKEALLGKGAVNNQFNAFIMDHLEKSGVETHHIEVLNNNDSLVHKLDTVKSNIQDVLSEGAKDESVHGVYIDENLRCDQCMKSTLERIVSSKKPSQTLASFLGDLCKEGAKKKCEKFEKALIGNTEAKGRKKAVKWYCRKVHKVCKQI